ncbi:chitobiase/beta-hexosaminidase C-terminal domain-containing protein [Rheinheimera sp. FR7-31]|uniref:chitobiase/beta-hexosaminidase C-terminal domain-containing protein n=1 Tax=Rheinheimera fenheensis TaxID=3152295 RepID=UPI00325C8492
MWNASANTTSYRIRQSVNGSWQTEINKNTTRTHSFSVSPGNSYQYQVRACGAAGCSAWSAATAAIAPPAIPAVPVGLNASQAGLTINTAWNASSNATSYLIRQSVNGSWQGEINKGTARSHPFTATPGSTYQYQVRACGQSGCSAWSAATAAITPPAIPAIPGGLTAPLSALTINTTWNAASNATSYRIRQSVNGSWQGEINKGTTRTHAFTVTPGSSYQYQVRACGTSGCSAWSAATSSVTPPPVPAVPPKPTGAQQTTSSILVSWAGSAPPPVDPCQIEGNCHCQDGQPCIPQSEPSPEIMAVKAEEDMFTTQSSAVSYRVQQRLGSGSWQTEVNKGSSTNHTYTGLAAGSYTYRVRACNSSGCSNWSGISSAATIVAPPAVPGGLSASQNTGSLSINSSWNAVSGATSYRIRQNVNGSWQTEINKGTNLTHSVSVVAGSSYQYQVKACNTGGCSAWSAATAAITPPAIPAIPGGLTAPLSALTINTTWNAASNATSYRIRQSVNGSWQGEINKGTTRTHAFTVTPGSSYQYQVRACGTSGCSAWSAATSSVTPPPVPASPASPMASLQNGNNIVVSWSGSGGGGELPPCQITGTCHCDDYNPCIPLGEPDQPQAMSLKDSEQSVTVQTNAVSYRLQGYRDGAVWGSEIVNISGTSRSVSWSQPGAYTFKVRACNSSGCSAYTALSNTVTISQVATPAATPNGGTHSGHVNVTLNTATAGAVVRYTLNNSAVTGSSTQYTAAIPLSQSTTIRAKAFKAGMADSGEVVKSFTLVPDVPAKPSASGGGSRISVSWQAEPSVATFKLRQSTNSGTSWQEIPVSGNSACQQNQCVFNDASAGVYSYQLSACNSSGCSNWSVSSESVVITASGFDSDFIANVPAVVSVTVPHESVASAAVIAVNGSFSVTNQGAATYTIPLEVPQGVGGFAPELSLQYSSLSSSGDAGLGWSLSAVSSLSRCQKVLEEDGLYQEITFTHSDALCLGGEKLRLVSGTNLAGGAEYRLDKQPDIKIVQTGSGVSSYFTVYRPNGDTLTYGDSDNSLQIDTVSGMPHAWLQSAHFNLFGQKIEYQYQRQQDYAPLLQYIRYAGNQVEIVYEDRPDPSAHYYLGNKLVYNSRIADIIVRNHSNQAIRSYHLGYKQSGFSDRSLLQTVQMCNGTASGVCSLVTQLNYSDYDYAGLQSQDVIINLANFEPVQGESNCSVRRPNAYCLTYKLQAVDIDGNGKRDLLVSSHHGEVGKIMAFEIGNNVGGYKPASSKLDVGLRVYRTLDDGEGRQFYEFPWGVADTAGTGIYDYKIGYAGYYDWSGDGIDRASPRVTDELRDYIQDNFDSSYPGVDRYFEAYGIGQKMSDFLFDYNGDGLLDRAIPIHRYEEVYDPETGDTPASFLGEFWIVEINRSVGTAYTGELLTNELWEHFDKPDTLGDVNGDGITDYFTSVRSGRRGVGTTGMQFGVDIANCDPKYTGYINCLKGVSDINGDGKEDVVYLKNGGIYWRQSLSSSNAPEQLLTTVDWQPQQTAPFLWADLDGDDQPELIYFDIAAQKIHIRFDRNLNNEVLDKLISIENGLGKNYAIEYRRLNDSQVYQKGTGAAAVNWGRGSKVRDIVSTMPVVAKVTEVTGLSQSGQPLRKEINYSYKGMKTQAGGRGALGFSEVTTEDITAKTKTIKYFRQDPPYNGLLDKSDIFVDGKLAERTTVLTWWNLASNNNQSRFVAPRKQQTDKYYLNADYGDISSTVAASTTVAETTVEMTAANYPRVKNTVTTLSDLLDSSSSSQTVSYEYTDEDLANWRIKRPTRTVTTRSRSGQSSISQTADTVYNTNGSVQQVLQEPDSSDASLYLQTFMRYDDKGNLTEQTQCSLHFAQNCGDASVPATQDNAEKVFRRKTFSYDSAGRYLTKISNPHYTEQSFHSFNKLGQAQEVRFNQYDTRAGQREYYRYDSFGERYFSYNNQGSSSKVTKQLCSNRSDCPANAILAVVMSSPNQPDAITYLDNSGNKVRQAAQLLDGRWSLMDTVYDSQSRPVKVSKPYIIGQATHHETISYDALGRKGTVQSADDLTTRFSYYAGKVTQHITGSYSDEASSASLDRTREEQHNGRGEVSYSTDGLGNNTHFTYTALGLPETVTGVDGAVTSLSYDRYGRRIGMDDPDKGNISYGFNALGEDVSRSSPDGVVKTHYRNAIGQVVSINTVQGATSLSYSFNYANTPFIQQQNHNGSVTSYSYDSYHRPFTESYQLDNKSWSRTYYYDEYGRLFRDMDIAGNGYGQQFQYAYGHMNRIFEVKTGQAYYRMLEADAYQNLTQAEAANHIQVERDYDAKSGRLTGLFAGFGLIQHQYYRYDQLGNLRYRSNLNAFGSADLIESFGYDELNRLETVTFNGVLSQQIAYLDNGNILTKSDVENAATYQYGTKASSCSVTPGEHAVSQIGTRRFCYDARGNQTHRYVGSSLTRRVDYTAFDKPHTIWSNQGESRFSYDATEKLVKRIDKKAGGDMVTYYVGGHEAIYQPDGSSEIKRYIRDIAIHTIKSSGSQSLHYVFNDHLGSGSVITDADGNVVETASFDAFGKRRNANSWQGYTNPFSQLPNLAALLNITQKGYTGHIQVDHAAVIHMGGRIYDPDLGRFMQADPIVQDPRDAQSLNRYSYVFNNPLSYTDPTGYDCNNLKGKPCNSALKQQKEDAVKAAQTKGSSSNAEVSQGNSGADLQNSARAANRKQLTPEQKRELRNAERKAQRGGRDLEFWREVVNEFINYPGGYAKQFASGFVNNVATNTPQAAADVSGYTTAVEIADAVKARDGQALAIAVVVGVARPLKIAERLDDVIPGQISVDEALDKAGDFLKDGVPVRSIDGKTGVQFIQEFTENGQEITKRVGFDLNPNSSHVQQLGPHLNLQTQINGKIQKGVLADPHIPIDPKTIRPGDY